MNENSISRACSLKMKSYILMLSENLRCLKEMDNNSFSKRSERRKKIMSKKLDPRIPKDSGSKSLTNYAALCSPWNHLVGYQEAMHWLSRYNASFSAACMQAYRILMPDYRERAQAMCEAAYQKLYYNNETVWENRRWHSIMYIRLQRKFCRSTCRRFGR